MRENSLTELDFDTAMELARSDPEAFERYRRAVIEALIARAPERNRQHLRRLQWRIDQERQRASNPTAAFLKLYRMMWDSFAGEYGLIDTICNARPAAQSQDQLPASAEVIAFPGVTTGRSSSSS
jgi:hypothetical protein